MNLKNVFDAILKDGHYVQRTAPGGQVWVAISMQFADGTWELFRHETDTAALVISHVGYNFRASYYGTADDHARWKEVVKQKKEIYEAGQRAFQAQPPEMRFALIYGTDSDKLLQKMFPEKTKAERDALREAVGSAFPEVRKVLRGFDAKGPEIAPVFSRGHLVVNGIASVPIMDNLRYQVLRADWLNRSPKGECVHGFDRFAVIADNTVKEPHYKGRRMVCAVCGEPLCSAQMGPCGPCIREPNHHGAHGDLFSGRPPSKVDVLFGADPIPLHPSDMHVAVHRKAVLAELDSARDREPYQISKPMSDDGIVAAAHEARNARTDAIAEDLALSVEAETGKTWEEVIKEGSDE